MDVLLLVYSSLFCGIWIMLYLSLVSTFGKIPSFRNIVVNYPDPWPKLSVIVPACNEEKHIEQTTKTLIEQDYPDLEIILVNDRSTDKTGEIIDRLAVEYPQVRPIHIKHLPDNWLGKVYALSEGKKQVTGEWMLFTDADIKFSQGILQKAVAYAGNKEIDHLALMPKIEMDNLWLEATIRAFGLFFLVTTRAADANKASSKAYVGVGAFNLVKKSSFDKTPGFEWLRMETVDDVGVGLLMNRHGGKSHIAFANDELALGWYETIPDMFRGLEKNLFGAGPGYNLFNLAVQLLFIWSLIAAPFMALFTGNFFSFTLGVIVISLYLILSVIFVRINQFESWGILLLPLGALLLSAMMIWAAYNCLKNGGINWRGTHYPTAALRAGRRVKLKMLGL